MRKSGSSLSSTLAMIALDRLGLDARLGRVVDAAGQVAVGLDFEGRCEESREHAGPFVEGMTAACDTTPGSVDGSGWADWRRTMRERVPMHLTRMRRGLARGASRSCVAGPCSPPCTTVTAARAARAAPRPGDLVVVRLPDGVVAVKRATVRRDDGWWVERDNPAEGVDSWLVGAIPDADVVAVVRARLRPLLRRRGAARPRPR